MVAGFEARIIQALVNYLLICLLLNLALSLTLIKLVEPIIVGLIAKIIQESH